MSKTRKVSLIAKAAVFALFILFGLFGCTLLLQDGSKEGDWYIKLNITQPASAKAITVTEYDVTGLAIEVYDPADQLIDTIAWAAEEGLMSYLIPVSQEGLHKIEVTHIGEKDGEVVEAEESATFNIQAMVITVIDIIPGSIGVINVEPGGEVPNYLLGTWENTTEIDPPRLVVTITETTFESNFYGGSAPNWVHLFGVRGTYTISGDTVTWTLTALTAPYMFSYYDPYDPYLEYPDWYYSWDYASHPYIYFIYDDYFGAPSWDQDMTLSDDGNTLFMTVDTDYGPFTITFARVS